ncbi:MAG: hypothetical protein ACQCN3_02250 [Candidatus Bathyarchaeia archaeon]|jgi:hypothetical protein
MNSKKILLFLVTIVATVMLLTSQANAVAPNVQLTVSKPYVNTSENQIITATANKGGIGILFVIQPEPSGDSWQNYLDTHPALKKIWNQLPDDIKNEIGEDFGDLTISYALVNFKNIDGGSKAFYFPADFTDLTGEPSTSSHGEYTAIFAYITSGGFFTFKISFDCVQWFALPESPFGSAMTLLTPIVALAAVVTIKKTRHFRN